MAEIFNSLSNLEIRFLQEISPQSADRTPTALYQFVVHGTNKFLAQVNTNYDLKFEAFYQHQGKFYPHPYTLRPQINYPINSSLIVEQYSQLIYDISLYLELKRLQDFDREDLKRYYEAIDQSVDTNQDLQDFHDIYLVLQYTINGQSDRYQCHNGQPIHLPRFISHRWTHKNTLTRFRYDAEMRDGTFPCEMTLCRENVLQLQSYKIVLCFITNTIPPRMDYHAIRWSSQNKNRKERRSSVRNNGEEKLYYLHDPSGIVIAQVFGPDLKFSPQRFHSVRSYNEPSDFRNQLDKSDNKDNSLFAIAVIKGSDYPIYMKNRRRNPNILRYLPFNELDDDKKNLNMREEEIVKRPKTHKAKCNPTTRYQ